MTKKKTSAEFVSMAVKYKCDERLITVEIDAYDISSSASDCDLCGSHGDVTIGVKCPLCKVGHHEFTIREW